jgi:hypothetical protein
MVPLLAAAQPSTPGEWYKHGEDQYNLGNFDKAIEAFKKGFELEPDETKKSAYLYNIAQSYRQTKDCFQAQFFYKRFLSLRANNAAKPLPEQTRKDVEDRIKELEECARQQEATRNKPPDNLNPDDPKQPVGTKPPDKKIADTTPPDDDDDDDDNAIVETAPAGPKLISLRASGGGAKLTLADLDIPLQATVGILGGYPLKINDKVTVDVGAGFTFTPLPFENMDGQSKSAQLIGFVANAGGTYHIAPKIGLRGDLGIGALVFTGASESPFTAFAPTSGALTMLHVRVGVSADYAITPNVIATLTPLVFSYSPGKDGLVTDTGEKISSITALDFMVGLGYRM